MTGAADREKGGGRAADYLTPVRSRETYGTDPRIRRRPGLINFTSLKLPRALLHPVSLSLEEFTWG